MERRRCRIYAGSAEKKKVKVISREKGAGALCDHDIQSTEGCTKVCKNEAEKKIAKRNRWKVGGVGGVEKKTYAKQTSIYIDIDIVDEQ